MSIKPGQRFGRYRIEKALGSGGMGSVFLAHDSKLDRRVALKTTLEGRNAGDKTLERFYREARAAANFRHPNLCKVYDVGEIEGIHYLTMEYIEGRPLLDLLQPGEALPAVETATAIGYGAAVGLAEAHRLGVIHRDLKPANIMIDREGVPVIVDFGMARGDFGGEPALTEAGTFLGTRSYASPEQWAGDPSRIGPASDIYSMARPLSDVVRPAPVRRPDPERTHASGADGPPGPSLGGTSRTRSTAGRDLPAGDRKAPDDRFGSMTEFAESLLRHSGLPERRRAEHRIARRPGRKHGRMERPEDFSSSVGAPDLMADIGGQPADLDDGPRSPRRARDPGSLR